VVAVRFVAAGVRWLQSRGTHGAHDRGLSFATATDTKACIWRHPRTCRYPILRLRARGSRVVAKIATKKTCPNISKPEQHNILAPRARIATANNSDESTPPEKATPSRATDQDLPRQP
jgi:hypothetical protein